MAAARSQQFTFQNGSFFIDDTKIMHVYGEIKNISDNAMKNIIVKASFYDSRGKFLNEFQRESEITILNPGEKSSFEILYIDTKTVNQVTNFTLSATATETTAKPKELLVVAENSRLDPVTGFYYINGRVTNAGSRISTNSTVIATFYDKDGKVISIGRTQAEPLNIASQSNGAFGLASIEKLQTYKIKTFSLAAESDEYLTIPEFHYIHVVSALSIFTAMSLVRLRSTHGKDRLRSDHNI